MADSAAARMTSCVVDSVKVELEMEGSWVTLMMEVTPALRRVGDGVSDGWLEWRVRGRSKMTEHGGWKEGAEWRVKRWSDSQHTHAHRDHHANLFFTVHSQGPDDLPGHHGQDDIHGARVDLCLLATDQHA